MIFKLSVLASGAILLDSEPIDLPVLDQKLAAADRQNTAVWYYREAAAQPAPVDAQAVIQLVLRHKLRISLSSKPDFSDYIDAKGVSHPRAGATGPQIPEVSVATNIDEIFGKVRKIAAGEKREGGLVILRPNRSYLMVPRMPDDPGLKKFADALAQLVPPGVQRNVAVISTTEFGDPAPSVADVGKAIPFLGLLMGLSYLGHAVWIFEGHPSALQSGLREADALIVDSAVVSSLPAGWQETARAAMRSPNILLHDRATSQLGVVSKIGTSPGRLEFNA